MAEWEKNDVPENGESPAGGHHEAPPDLSFEMPNNIAALSQDASWAEQPSEQEPSSEETAPAEATASKEAVPAASGSAPAHGKKLGAKERFLRILGNVVPKKGDPPLEIVRKCVFFVALLTLIGSAAYIVNDMVIVPYQNQLSYTGLESEYNPDNPEPVPPGYEDYDFPEGMSDAFKALYLQNTELRGWLKYTDNANGWLDISYPVMYSGDNEKYLELDFYQTQNKNGALFFDAHNNVDTADAANRALIIYGHNMASGQMFAHLNDFLTNLEKAKSAPVIQLDTLFERKQYKVFAVMLINNREPK